MELKHLSVVVVGSGAWGSKIAKWLVRNYSQFEVTNVGARDFLAEIEGAFKPMNSADGFYILATTPLLQTKILGLLAPFDVLIWAEKPLACDLEQALILSDTFQESAARVLINFVWLFSDVWQETLREIQKLEDIAEIHISRGGPGPIRTYISPLEDYGSHDLALLISAIDKEFSVIKYEHYRRGGTLLGESFEVRFQRGIKVSATYDLELPARTAVWEIIDTAGNSINVDFYAGKIWTHSNALTANRYLSDDIKTDNLGNFLLSLLNCSKKDSNNSLELGVLTQMAVAKIQGNYR